MDLHLDQVKESFTEIYNSVRSLKSLVSSIIPEWTATKIKRILTKMYNSLTMKFTSNYIEDFLDNGFNFPQYINELQLCNAALNTSFYLF